MGILSIDCSSSPRRSRRCSEPWSRKTWSRLSDEARLALQALDRQVRSGNLLYDPGDEAGSVDPFSVEADGHLFRV